MCELLVILIIITPLVAMRIGLYSKLLCDWLDEDNGMRKYLTLLLTVFFSSAVTASVDQHERFEEYPYIGIGYSALSGDIDLTALNLGTLSFDNGMLGVIAGYRFHPNFAAEVRGYGNVSDDEILGANFEIESSFSVLGKALIPIGKYVELFGTLGFAKSSAEASANGVSVSVSDEDVQYGVGIAFNKGEQLELQVEWMRLFDDDGLEVDGFNINLVYRL